MQKPKGNAAVEDRFNLAEGEGAFCCRDPSYNIW